MDDGTALVGYFEKAIDWMLNGQHGQRIRGAIRGFSVSRDRLAKDDYPSDALKLVVKTKITNSLRLKPRGGNEFETDWTSFFRQHEPHFRTPQAADGLAALVEAHSARRLKKGEAQEFAAELLRYHSLRDFNEALYQSRRNGGDSLIGDKGADHYLRNVGYFDVAPVDIHERRFLIRTGIFHRFCGAGRDPLDYRHLQDALGSFCSCMKDAMPVEGIDLSKSAGIVDLFIWYYCADGCYTICGKNPLCSRCGLLGVCYLGGPGQGVGSRPTGGEPDAGPQADQPHVSQPPSAIAATGMGTSPVETVSDGQELINELVGKAFEPARITWTRGATYHAKMLKDKTRLRLKVRDRQVFTHLVSHRQEIEGNFIGTLAWDNNRLRVESFVPGGFQALEDAGGDGRAVLRDVIEPLVDVANRFITALDAYL